MIDGQSVEVNDAKGHIKLEKDYGSKEN
jgi:hypothetical protein